MPEIITVARTGLCEACAARLVHILTVELLGQRRKHGDALDFRCPKCGEAGTIEGKASEHISGLQTRVSSSLW